MTSRSAKQDRRTPHSSSGNINFAISSGSDNPYSKNHEYIPHNLHSNTSLQSFGSGGAAGISAQERIVKSLVDKLYAKVCQVLDTISVHPEIMTISCPAIRAFAPVTSRSINLLSRS